MSDRHFRLLTIALIVATIGISVLLPHIELVLGILGSTIGAVICFIFPALIFLYLTNKNTTERLMAQLVVFTGIFILIVCTFTTLHDIQFVKDNDIIEHFEPPKTSTFNRIIEHNLDPEAIKKEEKELKLMIPPKTQQILHEYKVKQIPTIDANKAKRQEELLQRLEKQQQEHKKLLDQQKELLVEMNKHNQLHHDLESKNLVISPPTFSNHSVKKNLTQEHSQNSKAQNFYSIDKPLERNDKKPTDNKAFVQLEKREDNPIPKSVVNEKKLSPVLSDKNVIEMKPIANQQQSNKLNANTSKKTSKIEIESHVEDKQVPIEKQQGLLQNEKLESDHLFNKTLLNNKESEVLLRRNALSSAN